tara:strand:+ start:2699 stop:3301 length:603 start_codon:yes stop_codon:yes gene_type:complete
VKNYSPACDKNKKVILYALQRFLVNQPAPCRLLEIGSGTGQHAAFFASQFPFIEWQPSDKKEKLSSINAWQKEAKLPNLLPAITVDIDADDWPIKTSHHVFTANTAHIISADQLKRLVNGVAAILLKNGYFFIYGPFNYRGQFTSASNAEFDQWLKRKSTQAGIRDFEMLNSLAHYDAQFSLTADLPMPSNNRMLVFQKN